MTTSSGRTAVKKGVPAKIQRRIKQVMVNLVKGSRYVYRKAALLVYDFAPMAFENI